MDSISTHTNTTQHNTTRDSINPKMVAEMANGPEHSNSPRYFVWTLDRIVSGADGTETEEADIP